MRITVDQTWLLALVLTSARILAWSLVAPPLASGGLPRSVRGVVSVALALAVVPVTRLHVPHSDAGSIATALIIQIVLGAGLGFLTRLVFAAVEAAGGLIDVFSGFTLSAAYNPLETTMTSVFGGFYGILCTTLIFVTNVHLIIFAGFLRTFTAVPLNSGFSINHFESSITSGATNLFVAALQIAGPLVVVLLIADVSLGVLNRIAPQLNAFQLSFPFKIGLTLLLGGLGMMLLPQTVVQLAGTATRAVSGVI